MNSRKNRFPKNWSGTQRDKEKAKLLKESKDVDADTAQKCWEELSNKHHPWLYKLSQSWLNKLRLGAKTAPEDAVNEILIEFYKGIHNYDPNRGAFSTWLKGLAIKRLLKLRREIIKPGLLEVDKDIESLTNNLTDTKKDFINEIIAREMVDKLSDYFKSIEKEQDFQILELRYLHDMSFKEIAIQIGEIDPKGKDQRKIDNATERVRKWFEEAQRLAIDFLNEI